MGYGEFGGGGSIHWVTVPGGGGSVSNGVDAIPAKGSNGLFGGGKFVIKVNGEEIGEWAIEDNPRQIQIYWTPHKPSTFDPDADVLVGELRKKNKEKTATAGV
jgi:hypothetical protein